MRNYEWFAIGAGFDGRDERITPFMRNASSVSSVLDQVPADLETWRTAVGFNALYLVLENDPEVGEPIIEPERRGKRDVQIYGVRAHWLAEAFIDPELGSWQLLVHVVAVLTTISRESGLPLPRLFSPIPADWKAEP